LIDIISIFPMILNLNYLINEYNNIIDFIIYQYIDLSDDTLVLNIVLLVINYILVMMNEFDYLFIYKDIVMW
jgi:hypothetical protein